MTCQVSLIAFDDCLASAVIGSKDLFCASNTIAAQLDRSAGVVFETQILSVDGKPVRAVSGDRIVADAAFADARPAQLIMVPGISLIDPGELLSALERLQPTGHWLKQQHAAGSWLAATCTGVFMLADAGLLDGRRATTTSWFEQLFQQRYPQVHFDDSGTIVAVERIACSGGAFSYVDLTLYLIEQLASRELARACARYIVMDNRRGARAPELIRHHARTHDPLVVKADRWMRANMRRDISVQDIADQMAVSTSTLMRRFKEATGTSPLEHLQKIRLEAGKALLANSKLRMDQILERIGYQDDSAFRRLFKRHTNLSPREYRQRFSGT
jgi:transcriptional regulator GlxA family with amidase domain